MSCLFCKMVRREIPAKRIYEDEFVFAIDDINPLAPVHTLIIPKAHVESLNEMETQTPAMLINLMKMPAKIAGMKGIKNSGYRVIVNTGSDAGQSVPHLHIHVLGGEKLPETL